MRYAHLEDEKLEEYAKGNIQPYIAMALVPALAMELMCTRKERDAYKMSAIPRSKDQSK